MEIKILIVIVLCMMCQMSGSDFLDDYNVYENDSIRNIVPTPLIVHLNRSAIQTLIQEVNSMFVSNTSLGDFKSNNETQYLLLQYRDRKREERLQGIQRDVLVKLGFNQSPNITMRLTSEERESLVSSFDKAMLEQQRFEEEEDSMNSTDPASTEV